VDQRFSVGRADYSYPVSVTSNPDYRDKLRNVRANSLGLQFNALRLLNRVDQWINPEQLVEKPEARAWMATIQNSECWRRTRFSNRRTRRVRKRRTSTPRQTKSRLNMAESYNKLLSDLAMHVADSSSRKHFGEVQAARAVVGGLHHEYQWERTAA
jgi:hypothetical protein